MHSNDLILTLPKWVVERFGNQAKELKPNIKIIK